MEKPINLLYNYGTDFIINTANLLHLSYYEINLFLFGFLYPLLLIGLPFTLILQKIKISKRGNSFKKNRPKNDIKD